MPEEMAAPTPKPFRATFYMVSGDALVYKLTTGQVSNLRSALTTPVRFLAMGKDHVNLANVEYIEVVDEEAES